MQSEVHHTTLQNNQTGVKQGMVAAVPYTCMSRLFSSLYRRQRPLTLFTKSLMVDLKGKRMRSSATASTYTYTYLSYMQGTLLP
jgi:hypothetical protein